MIEFIRQETADGFPEGARQEGADGDPDQLRTEPAGRGPEAGSYDSVAGYVRCRTCVWFAPYNGVENDPTGLCVCSRSPCWNQTVEFTFFCADWGRK